MALSGTIAHRPRREPVLDVRRGHLFDDDLHLVVALERDEPAQAGARHALQAVFAARERRLHDDDITTYHFVAAVLLAAYLFIQRVVHLPFGQMPRGLREKEARAVSLNHDVERFEPVAFVLSAALAGLSGAMKTLTLGFELLADAHWHTSRSSGLR